MLEKIKSMEIGEWTSLLKDVVQSLVSQFSQSGSTHIGEKGNEL